MPDVRSIASPGAASRPRFRLAGVGVLLALGNLAVWAWAMLVCRHQSVLLGTALLAYGFGLRHAVDADHIAAIDNVTRKLMQQGRRPVTVGLYFALGHSTVVVLAAAAIAATSATLAAHFGRLQSVGGVISTIVSACFMFAIASLNLAIFRQVRQAFRHVTRGGDYAEADLELLLGKRGVAARLFRPLFALISRSWQMFPLGVLFGLGFDTATEIALLGISATQSAHGLPAWSIMVFPALFAAGMSLVDTADGILMLGVYDWAFIKPVRKLYYNMTITMVSVIVAGLIGGIELLGLIVDRLALSGRGWRAIAALDDNFSLLGLLVIGVFVAAWIVSVIVYRARCYDSIEITPPA